MREFSDAGARFYDSYDDGVVGDLEFYLEESKADGGPVLELGTGTGRILLPLAEAGLEVTGLDISSDMLAIAEQKVLALDPQVQERIDLVEAPMSAFSLPCRYKTVLIPNRAFQHLLTPADQRNALSCIRECLLPGGRLLFNTVEPSYEELVEYSRGHGPALRLDGKIRHPDTDQEILVWYCREYFPDDQLLEQLILFEVLDDTGLVVEKHATPLNVRYTPKMEMQYLLELSGFQVEALYGSFGRHDPYLGGEQVWLARKHTSHRSALFEGLGS